MSRKLALALVLPAAMACRLESPPHPSDSAMAAIEAAEEPITPAKPIVPRPVLTVASAGPRGATRAPNLMGRIPILEYHLIGQQDGRWERHHEAFRRDLALLYARGYRPITVGELVSNTIRIPAGMSPVIITFDDASPSQFRYVERGGALEIDSTSAVGIWMDFNKKHPDWGNKGVFCLLPGAEAGRSFFGNRGIEGQKTEWRFRKLQFLAEQGFELCNHTLWHANLSKYSDADVQEQIARGVMAIDSAVPGYKVRTFALPLGAWPKNRDLAKRGSWLDPRTGKTVTYDFDAILLVAGDAVPSPRDPAFNALRLERIQVLEGVIEKMLARLERDGRYVSDGAGGVVAEGRPTAPRRDAGVR